MTENLKSLGDSEGPEKKMPPKSLCMHVTRAMFFLLPEVDESEAEGVEEEERVRG